MPNEGWLQDNQEQPRSARYAEGAVAIPLNWIDLTASRASFLWQGLPADEQGPSYPDGACSPTGGRLKALRGTSGTASRKMVKEPGNNIATADQILHFFRFPVPRRCDIRGAANKVAKCASYEVRQDDRPSGSARDLFSNGLATAASSASDPAEKKADPPPQPQRLPKASHLPTTEKVFSVPMIKSAILSDRGLSGLLMTKSMGWIGVINIRRE